MDAKTRRLSFHQKLQQCLGFFAEILAVVKQNNHPEFDKYYEIAVQNGMDSSVLEKKLKELTEVKQSFIEIEMN